MCQLASLCLTVCLAAAWLGVFLPGGPTPLALIGGGVIAALLLAHSVRWLEPVLATFAVAAVHLMTFRLATSLDLTLGTLVSATGLALVAQWLVAGMLQRRRPARRVTRALATPARWVTGIELTALLTAVVLPGMWARALGMDELLPTVLQPWTPVAAVVIAWGCGAARRCSSRGLAAIACVAAFGFVVAVSVSVTGNDTYLLAVLAATAIAATGAAEWLTRNAARRVEGANDIDAPPPRCGLGVLVGAATAVSLAVLTVVAVASLVTYDAPAQIGGVVAAAELCLVRGSGACH